MPKENWVSAFSKWWPVLAIVVIWFVAFWPMNTGQTVAGFRDSEYLYYPYFKWIDAQWKNGDVPLWNPYCDFGYPVVADGTSSVFYPGKLIFFARFLDYPTRYGWYLSLHVLLAALSACFLAWRLRANQWGALLAGISYGFGGSVLFQVCNAVFLVSAAWLPFGLAAVWAMSKSSQSKYPIAAGIVAAMMILGGDPQMAYLLAVIAGLTMAWRCFGRRKRLMRRKLMVSGALQYCKRLSIFALATMLLASIQLLPTYFWSQQSSRTDAELNVVGLTVEGRGGEALNAVYQFSQPPWSMAELVWPNVSGKPFPIHRRWVEVLAGNDRFWTPSLYVGLLTLLCAIFSVRFRGRSKSKIWFSSIFFAFAIGSFGWYGIVWLYRETVIQMGGQLPTETDQPGPYVGGLYWLATIVLPKFVMFRYPAKLFVVASLSLCILAGVQISSMQLRKLIYLLVPVFVISMLGYLLLPIFWPDYTDIDILLMTNANWDVLFGALDWQGSASGVRYALLQTSVVSFVMAAVILLADRKLACPLIVSVFVVELVFANYWLVPQVDSRCFESPTSVAHRIEQTDWTEESIPAMIPGPLFPPQFLSSSENRLAEIVEHRRQNLHPKHHLDAPVRLMGSFATIEHPGRRFLANMTDLIQDQPRPLMRPNFPVAHVDAGENNENLPGSHVQRGGVTVTRVTCNQIDLHVVNGAEGKLIHYITPDRGWRVYVKKRGGSEKVVEQDALEFGRNRIAFGLPAGDFVVSYRYQPTEFWVGAWISLLSWIGLGGWATVRQIRT